MQDPSYRHIDWIKIVQSGYFLIAVVGRVRKQYYCTYRSSSILSTQNQVHVEVYYQVSQFGRNRVSATRETMPRGPQWTPNP